MSTSEFSVLKCQLFSIRWKVVVDFVVFSLSSTAIKTVELFSKVDTVQSAKATSETWQTKCEESRQQ